MKLTQHISINLLVLLSAAMLGAAAFASNTMF